jgi:hypothetical protein
MLILYPTSLYIIQIKKIEKMYIIYALFYKMPCLGLVELLHPKKHGTFANENIYSHHLYSLNIPARDFFTEFPNGYICYTIDICGWLHTRIRTHPFIKNYEKIIQKKGHLSLEIIEIYTILQATHAEYSEPLSVCVIKTFWLKIFQRKWKKYYHKKMRFVKNPKSLMNRQIYGKWVYH